MMYVSKFPSHLVKMTLYYKDGSPRHGNRCKLSRNQTIHMSILSKKSATRQVDFEMWLGINQSTISRAIEYIDCILVKALPTANVIQQKIKDADATTLDQFMPDNEHMIDSAEFTMKRPHDNDVQKEYYSGKKEKTTYCKIDDRYKQTWINNLCRIYPQWQET